MPESFFPEALFFGTFNPIHNGHLAIANAALSQCGFESVCFIPAADPPHRRLDSDMADAEMRLAMVRLAIRHDPRLRVSDVELRQKLSYSIDTLRFLSQHVYHTQARLPFIIGADALSRIQTWHEADALIERVRFIVAGRPDCPLALPKTVHHTMLEMPLLDISSSIIRERLRHGETVSNLLPAAVLKFIQEHALYLR